MQDVIRTVQEFLGGGMLTVWIVGGALLAIYVAYKAAKFAVRIFAAVVAVVLLVSTASWSEEGEDGPRADCIIEHVTGFLTTWEAFAAKRMTVDAEPTAECTIGEGVDQGSATVTLRTFFDIPFQTIEISPAGIDRSIDLPTDN